MDTDDLRKLYTEIHKAPRRAKQTNMNLDQFIVEAGRRGAELEGKTFTQFVTDAIIDRLERIENAAKLSDPQG